MYRLLRIGRVIVSFYCVISQITRLTLGGGGGLKFRAVYGDRFQSFIK